MSEVYEKAKIYKKKYPGTISWRLKAHSKVIEKHLNPGETVKFVFAAQKNEKSYHIFCTYIIALTNKRILLAQKRLIFGYMFLAITPDMFKSIDGEKGYFNNKNSLVSFIGNSIQVIHSKNHSITVKNFKSELKKAKVISE